MYIFISNMVEMSNLVFDAESLPSQGALCGQILAAQLKHHFLLVVLNKHSTLGIALVMTDEIW